MSIQVLSDVFVPDDLIAEGSLTGKSSRQNDRTMNQGGYVSVNAVRDVTMRSWQIGVIPMRRAEVQTVMAIYEVTDAGAFGMLMVDPIDSDVVDGALMGYMAGVESGVLGFGNGTPNYGLRKVYTAMGSTRKRARAITRPKGTPTLLRGGSPVTIGAAPGNAALTAAPVYVTFVADATRSVTAVTVGATTQVTLSSAIGLGVSDRLWLQGLTGADAALLNNLAHEITAISGGGSNVYTLAINTAGKTIAAAGQGHAYPQPDETLTWTGAFYVPVHFRDDDIEWDLIGPGKPDQKLIAIPATYLDEIREA